MAIRCQWKLDGLTLVLCYEKGNVVVALITGLHIDAIHPDAHDGYWLTKGMPFLAVAFIVSLCLYIWMFLGRLAKLYPEFAEKLLHNRKISNLFILFDKKHGEELEHSDIWGIKSALRCLKCEPDGPSIAKEWRSVMRCFAVFGSFYVLYYPIELPLALLGWMGAINEAAPKLLHLIA